MSFEQQIISSASAGTKFLSDLVFGVEHGRPFAPGQSLGKGPLTNLAATDVDGDKVSLAHEVKMQHQVTAGDSKLMGRAIATDLAELKLSPEEQHELDMAIKEVQILLAKDEKLLEKYRKACATLQGYTDGSNSAMIGQAFSTVQGIVALTAASAVFPPATLGLMFTGATIITSAAAEKIATREEKNQAKDLADLEQQIMKAATKVGHIYFDIVERHFPDQADYLSKLKAVMDTNSTSAGKDVLVDWRSFRDYLKNPEDSKLQHSLIQRAEHLEKEFPGQMQKIVAQGKKVEDIFAKLQAIELEPWRLLKNKEKMETQEALIKEYVGAKKQLAALIETANAWGQELKAYQIHLGPALDKQLIMYRERLKSGTTEQASVPAQKPVMLRDRLKFEKMQDEKGRILHQIKVLEDFKKQHEERQGKLPASIAETIAKAQEALSKKYDVAEKSQVNFREKRPTPVSTTTGSVVKDLPKSVLEKSGSVHWHATSITKPSPSSSSSVSGKSAEPKSGSSTARLLSQFGSLSAHQAAGVSASSEPLSAMDFSTSGSSSSGRKLRVDLSAQDKQSSASELSPASELSSATPNSASATRFTFRAPKIQPLSSIPETKKNPSSLPVEETASGHVLALG